jgi:hypothetical protein
MPFFHLEVLSMSRLLLVMVAFGLLAFAPAPTPRVETDPDKAIAQYETEAPTVAARGQEALADRKKKLVELLQKREAVLRKRGRVDEADAIRDRLTLLDTVDAGRSLERSRAGDVLKKAAAQGKYRKLLRVLYMPGDQAGYGPFRDYGVWNGSAYNGENNLPNGYWVYTYPRWFIWGELKER